MKQIWQPWYEKSCHGLKIDSELTEWGENPLKVKGQCCSWGRKVYWVGGGDGSRDESGPLNTITKISEGEEG